MRFVYTLVTYLLLPMALLHLWRRGRLQPAYRQHWRERFGYAPQRSGPVLWLHAVSVGETRAAAPLIDALLARFPEYQLLLSHTTPTGRATGAELFSRYGDRVVQTYLPYDLPGAVQRFIARTQPVLGILMETEIWPNLYAAAAYRTIPLFLVNARLSEKSARGYASLKGLTRTTLAQLTAIAAQTEADAERLIQLGAKSVTVCGNLKFDVTPPIDAEARAAALCALWGPRPVFLAASTRDGEEALILAAWQAQLDAASNASAHEPTGPATHAPLLVLVPRHPQRFASVAALLEERHLDFARRSDGAVVENTVTVLLGDSMGEMAAYYAAADVAFIGGSLLPLGGQNLIEAAAAGCPILLGPHTFNFTTVAAAALACGAAERVPDAPALVARATYLLNNSEARAAMAQAGRDLVAKHRGATHRTLAVLDAALL